MEHDVSAYRHGPRYGFHICGLWIRGGGHSEPVGVSALQRDTATQEPCLLPLSAVHKRGFTLFSSGLPLDINYSRNPYLSTSPLPRQRQGCQPSSDILYKYPGFILGAEGAEGGAGATGGVACWRAGGGGSFLTFYGGSLILRGIQHLLKRLWRKQTSRISLDQTPRTQSRSLPSKKHT